jgi:hypothetical protein
MRKILMALAVLVFTAACGGGDEGETQVADNSTETQIAEDRPSRQGIPDEDPDDYVNSAEARLFPAFDSAGETAAKSVAAGEVFDIYVIGRFSELFAMAGAEYKMSVPDGITVLGATQTDSVIITMGKPDVDVSIAFRCMQGPGDWISKYVCKVDDGFAGGDVELFEGDNMHFMGFVTCDNKDQIPARTTAAKLKRK